MTAVRASVQGEAVVGRTDFDDGHDDGNCGTGLLDETTLNRSAGEVEVLCKVPQDEGYFEAGKASAEFGDQRGTIVKLERALWWFGLERTAL